MHTLKLKINDQVYDKFILLLGKFTKEEVEIILEEPNFNETKKYLDAELNEIIIGNANFLTLNEAEQRLETRIRKHEDHL